MVFFPARKEKEFLSVLDDDKPTVVRSSIYVESFGNTEEANMVRTLLGRSSV